MMDGIIGFMKKNKLLTVIIVLFIAIVCILVFNKITIGQWIWTSKYREKTREQPPQEKKVIETSEDEIAVHWGEEEYFHPIHPDRPCWPGL